MDKLILFLTIIAWVFGVISTVYGALLLDYGMKYPGSLEETLDKFNGYTKVFNPIKFFTIAIVCFAFIIATSV
jgi:hypothetical protein